MAGTTGIPAAGCVASPATTANPEYPGRNKIDTFIFEWLQRNRDIAIFLVPVFAFAEACVGIGLLISGAILVAIGSVLLANDIANLSQILPLAMAGALLGDHAGFYTGRWIGPRFHHFTFAQKHRAKLQKSEAMIVKYGPYAIFIGRFLPAIRSLIPAMLGISGFNAARYSALDVGACLLWSACLGVILWAIENVIG
ncbi:DedA family protein [Pseudohongiella sp.]|uniref:DedA family protein n=1 Tax=Pseudohongiella sp. TaxID=1979412 RepID=UPI001791C2D7|nr:DedA family protein [Pseudohongiella sp.]HDZ08898.1 DedA family protein [Pseudohongiella sp.]HEA64024.1 DedA family protein [Pseudohongiella sp.]